MSKDMSDKWDYRVVRKITEKGITSAGDGEWLSVQEVYYDDETKEPMAHSIDLQVDGYNIRDIRKTLQSMLWCLDKEIVDEIESNVTTRTIEERLSYLETETDEIRDVISELDNRVVS